MRLRRGGTPVDWLVVGLGNPGPQYANTPHNVGHDVLAQLIARWELPRAKDRFAGRYTDGRTAVGGPRVGVLQSKRYMNESGESVGPARGALKVDIDHVLVIHDEIDLPFGDIRTRVGGGLAGHNGLKSIKAKLGSAEFARVRVGVGRPDSTDPREVSDYVLGGWSRPRHEVDDLVRAAADAAQRVVLGDEGG